MSLRVILGTYSSNDSQLSAQGSNLDRVEVIQFCTFCKGKTSVIEVGGILKSMIIHNLSTLERLETLAFPDFSQELMWIVTANLNGSKDSFLEQFDHCNQDTSSSQSSHKSSFSSHFISQRYSADRARVWMSIVKSSTFATLRSNHAVVCEPNGKKRWYRIRKKIRVRLEQTLLINSGTHASLAYPMRMKNKLNWLQFVSCGKRGYHSYSYHDT